MKLNVFKFNFSSNYACPAPKEHKPNAAKFILSQMHCINSSFCVPLNPTVRKPSARITHEAHCFCLRANTPIAKCESTSRGF